MTAIPQLPSALEALDEIRTHLRGREPAVFLDYDGTLTPIVEDPGKATVTEETRTAVEELARRCTVAVISGRDLHDVRTMLGVDGIVYAGSHGFDIAGPDGLQEQQGTEFLPALDRAEAELRDPLEAIPGARLERKGFAIAVHYRQTPEERIGDVEDAVDEVAARHPDLRKTGGKKIFELRPAIEWHKGRALLHVLEVLGLKEALPIYIGDDETDEDAFRALDDWGFGIVVGTEDRPTAARYALRDPDEARELIEALTVMAGDNE